MQEIKKRRIVLASVLKPVNDPRMFEKMGQSLSHNYEVHIMGTHADDVHAGADIFFHPLAPYARFSIDRVLAPFRILKKIFRLKPALLIVCTHELLWMVLIVKIFLPCSVVYDIRENYFRNILYTNSFPPILRVLIALYVRIKEWITLPLINNFFLAEIGYAHELGFVRSKMLVLENKLKKVRMPPLKKWSDDDQNIHLLFTGTLAPTTGIFVAIDLATKLHALDTKIRLHIVGFCPMVTIHQEIMDRIRNKSFVLFGQPTEPVAHLDIVRAIQQADYGIIAYPPNPSTQNTIPTKLFEYLGYNLPILLLKHEPWVEKCREYGAAVPFDAERIDAPEMLDAMKRGGFYLKDPQDVFWESEERKLLEAVSRLVDS